MPDYEYKVWTAKKEVKTGSITAKSPSDAKVKLQKMRLIPISIKVKKVESSGDGEVTPIIGMLVFKDEMGKVQIQLGNTLPSAKDLIIFTKQLATMVGSGVPLIQAISVLGRQQSNLVFRRALRKIQNKVENGSTLSAALGDYPKIFEPLYQAMVSAGEVSGNLDVILLKLISYIEKAEKIKSQVKAAMSYPVIVVVVAIAVVAGLLGFVVPVFAAQYAESGKALPGLTQGVIDFSNFFAANWYIIFGSMFLSVFLFRVWTNTTKGKLIFDTYILKAPVIGDLLRKIAVGRFCSTMSSMLSSGVNLLDALKICAASSGNKTIENFVLGVKKGLESGKKFSEPLAEGGLFPDMVISMVMVGESTGALDDMLNKVSIFYEEEVELAVKSMLSMIEPIMIVVIGSIIAVVIIAMYLPIFDMAGNVGE